MKYIKENKNWSISYLITLMIVIIVCIYQSASIYLLIITLCGVSYTMFIAKNQKIGLYIGVIYVIFYGLLMLSEKMYAGFFYNIIYSLPMLIYGIKMWENPKNTHDMVKKLTNKNRTILVIITVITILIVSNLLKIYGSQNTLLDSATSILGYIGLFFLSNRYIEQWYVYMVCNLSNIILWFVMCLSDMGNLPILIMFIIYFINSIYGYINWNQLLKNKQAEKTIV